MAVLILGKFFSPPTFPDERKTLEARKLWAVLIGLIPAISVLLPVMGWLLPDHAARAWAYMGIYDGECLGLLALARCGRTRLASFLLIALSASILTYSAWTAGGVRAPGMMCFLVLVAAAGILQGSRGAFLAAAGCSLLSLGLLAAERMGRLPPPEVRHTSSSTWIVLVFAMTELVMIQGVSNWVVRRAESRAQASVAERARTEAARREAADKFAKVFEASPDAIVVSDLLTGELLDVNPSYEKLFGYARAEVLGRTSVDLGIFADQGERQPMIDAVRASGGIRDWEMEARNRRGERIPLLFSGELIELGRRTCMVAVIHDITELKQAEASERRTRDEFTRKLLASQEAERRRIAAELHDSLGQNLILIKNRAQLALEAPGVPPALLAQFRSLREMAAQAIAEVRQISHDLRPHQLDHLGLTRALEAMINGAAQNSKFPIAHRLDPVDDLFTPEAATHLYRVAQETISNLLKHAQARGARIGLERDLREVRLWIEDDGQGFTPRSAQSAAAPAGLGLSSIAERVRIIGGTLRIDSNPGQGTRIEVVVPHPGIS